MITNLEKALWKGRGFIYLRNDIAAINFQMSLQCPCSPPASCTNIIYVRLGLMDCPNRPPFHYQNGVGTVQNPTFPACSKLHALDP
jgi:hypothetical protein